MKSLPSGSLTLRSKPSQTSPRRLNGRVAVFLRTHWPIEDHPETFVAVLVDLYVTSQPLALAAGPSRRLSAPLPMS